MSHPLAPFLVRPARDDDGDALAALIAGCFAEYPGCVFDRAAEHPELDAIASHFARQAGAVWVAEAAGTVVGSLATRLQGDEAVELLKVYVTRAARGRGIAESLLAEAAALARRAGRERLELWTDTRFERAHRFYEKHGFVRTGERRFLGDLSDSWEWRYVCDRPKLSRGGG